MKSKVVMNSMDVRRRLKEQRILQMIYGICQVAKHLETNCIKNFFFLVFAPVLPRLIHWEPAV